MSEIRTFHVTENFIAFDKFIVLEETKVSRRIFIPSFFDEGEVRHIRGTFAYQRRGANGWEDENGKSFHDLAAGEWMKFELGHAAMSKFLNGIGVLLKAADMPSIEERSEKFNVGLAGKTIEIEDKTIKPVIESLLKKGLGDRFWSELASMQPDVAEKFADRQILARRRESVHTFEQNLSKEDWNEPQWGDFFDKNQWIFGLGLRYQFLRQLKDQAHYGGTNYTGKGEQKGDFLHCTEGDERFTVLVEIKLPNSQIFHKSASTTSYRNGVPGFAVEFANALSQVQVNAHKWETEGSRTDATRDALEIERIRTVHPRTLLIYGTTSLLDSREKRESFEIFRGELKNTEIVTYDELLRRAKFIVGEMEDGTSSSK